MSRFESGSGRGFDRPTLLPRNPGEAETWQQANRRWWEEHSMRYDWEVPVEVEEFSREFYQEIDRRFFEVASEFLPPQKIPFDRLVDYEALCDMDVLEVGVGNGSHAQLLAQHARSFVGIDLTEYGVESSAKRMSCFGLDGTIRRMDAESMDFPDQSFDFVWSWGVIHHSANTPTILSEINRVLRPGGRCVTMVYHRGWWNYQLLHGMRVLLGGRLPTAEAIHASVQSRTDGAIARFYSRAEWRALMSQLFVLEKLMVMGPKVGLLPLPPGRLRHTIAGWVPNPVGRFLTNACGMGGLLVAQFRKPS